MAFGKGLLISFPGERGCFASSHHSRDDEFGVFRPEVFGDNFASLLDPLSAGVRGDIVKKKPRGIVSGVLGDIGGVLIRLASYAPTEKSITVSPKWVTSFDLRKEGSLIQLGRFLICQLYRILVSFCKTVYD